MHSIGWFENTAREVQSAALREEEARVRLLGLQEERKEKTVERGKREIERRAHERDFEPARNTIRRVTTFIEEHVRPSATWRTQLHDAKASAKAAAEEVRQWQDLADTAEARALVQGRAEEAK